VGSYIATDNRNAGRMGADQKALQEEMRAIFGADRGKMEATDLKANPVEMKSVVVHEEFCTKDAAMKSSVTMK
jgi:hypothetical protein